MAKVGIKEVAVYAGVSAATVSNSMRNPDKVSKQTREKVIAAIQEVGYVPNKLGVGLRTSKSYAILVIIPNVADSFYSSIIKAIEEVAFENNYSVLVGDTQGSKVREREYGALAESQQADGIIFFSNRLPFSEINNTHFIDELPPMINCCGLSEIKGLPSVSVDNIQAGKDAVQHLIELGHENIAAITGSMESLSSQNRLIGYQQALAEAKLPYKTWNVIHADYTINSGEKAAERFLNIQDRPTAIFCFSDEIAFGCIHLLSENGIKVPEDISVIGFDNIPFAKYMAPPLTTINQPTQEMGRICASLLIDLMAGKTLKQAKIVLPHKVILRKSTQHK